MKGRVTKYGHTMPELRQESEFRKEVMHSAGSQPQSGQWLLDSGLKQLELLFRAIIY